LLTPPDTADPNLVLKLSRAEPFEQQRGGTYFAPPDQVDPVYLPPSRSPQLLDSPPDTAVTPLKLRLAFDLPLRRGGRVELASQGPFSASPTLQAELRWSPTASSPWFASMVFMRYLHAAEQQPWSPDFGYSFGYDDYRPGTWSLTYANYTGTRLRPDSSRDEHRFNFAEGLWSVAWRFDLPPVLHPVFLRGDGDSAPCRIAIQLTPKFVDFVSRTWRYNRTALVLGCRYTRADGWFAELNLHTYPVRGQQQPWDPDFTYTFGRSDWDAKGWSLQYGNYSGNRLFGRQREPGEGNLRSGNITISWQSVF
jgi:hypothetical protein